MNSTDTVCVSPPYDVTLFPSVTSTADFDVAAYAAQIQAIEEASDNTAITLHEPSYPTVSQLKEAEQKILQHAGDLRFTGADVYNFLHTRYRHLDSSDIVNMFITPPSTTITLTACNFDGDYYTYTAANTAYFLDQHNKEIVLPVFDKYGQQVVFPLYTESGHILITETVSAYNFNKDIIFFPLKDANNNQIKYPFKDINNTTIVTLPKKNNILLRDVNEAYTSLDNAYNNAKDADAYKFIQYILSLSLTNKTSFFYSKTEETDETTAYLAAAIFNIDTPDIELSNLLSGNLKYFIRYYADRTDFIYNIYTFRGGIGPLTVISSPTSTNIADVILYEKIKSASYSILGAPFWSNKTESLVWESTTIKDSPVHTSLLELHTSAINTNTEINALHLQISALSATVDLLKITISNLRTDINTISAKVDFNSPIIDTLIVSNTWAAIWQSPPPILFTAPSVPAPRI